MPPAPYHPPCYGSNSEPRRPSPAALRTARVAEAKMRFAHARGVIEDDVRAQAERDVATAHKRWTPEARARFLEMLSLDGNVRCAARNAGFSHTSAYAEKRRNADFHRAWEAALMLARDCVEQVLYDRAIHGIEEAISYQGEITATRVRHHPQLLIALLARLDQRVNNDDSQRGAARFAQVIDTIARGGDAGPLFTTPLPEEYDDSYEYDEDEQEESAEREAELLARVAASATGADWEQAEDGEDCAPCDDGAPLIEPDIVAHLRETIDADPSLTDEDRAAFFADDHDGESWALRELSRWRTRDPAGGLADTLPPTPEPLTPGIRAFNAALLSYGRAAEARDEDDADAFAAQGGVNV